MAVARYPEELKAQARELRAAGMSVAQIAHDLGVRAPSVVQRWVADVPAPEWTCRPRAKDGDRERARELRQAGWTYPAIATELGVSKSSVSLWVRDLPRPPYDSSRDVSARDEGHRHWVARRREALEAHRAEQIAAAAAHIGQITSRELLLAAVVAYWAEGTKSKPWRRSDRVVFTNSDPDMIRLFLRFLGELAIPQDRLRFRVAIHRNADVVEATEFWAGLVGAPATRFQRPTLKKTALVPGRYNRGESYRGCLVVTVLRSRDLYRQIEGMWRAIGLSLTG